MRSFDVIDQPFGRVAVERDGTFECTTARAELQRTSPPLAIIALQFSTQIAILFVNANPNTRQSHQRHLLPRFHNLRSHGKSSLYEEAPEPPPRGDEGGKQAPPSPGPRHTLQPWHRRHHRHGDLRPDRNRCP